jgi:hypothetical protein
MSLKRPRVYGSGRCKGSNSTARNIYTKHDLLVNRDRRIGRCDFCGRWFDVTKAGHIRPHIDYRAEQHP